MSEEREYAQMVIDEWAGMPAETIQGKMVAVARALLSSPRVERETLKRAAQLAFDQTCDDPAPGTWNDACEHIAVLIRSLSPQEAK